jgi:DNA-binding LacI/PurR family transcriptional regulator
MNTRLFSPIYLQIVETLRRSILDGEYAEGDKLPPERELAEKFGVNRLTLQKAMNILSQQELLARCRGRGTFVTYRDKSTLRKLRIWMWGISPGNSGGYYNEQLYSGIKKAFGKRDLEPVLLDYRENLLTHYQQNKLDGLLLLAPPVKLAEEISRTGLPGIPHVILAAPFPQLLEGDFVTVDIDNQTAAGEMAQYLLGLGHEKIAYLSGALSSLHSLARLSGFTGTMKKQGARFNEDLLLIGKGHDYYAEDAYHFVGNLVKKRRDVTAVFAGGFQQTLGAMRATLDAGLQVPEDISIAGFDDFPLAQYAFPGLTTVRQPIEAMGELAGRMLLEQLENGDVNPRQKTLKAELMVRSSCREPKNRAGGLGHVQS